MSRFAGITGGAFALTLLFVAGSGQSAPPPLGEVKEIDDKLFIVAVAREIKEYCPSISARYFRAYTYLYDLKKRAYELGYSDDEIDAYMKNKEAKAAMRSRGEAYLAENGVRYEDPETFCSFGRSEIKNASQIGRLLKVK